METFLQIDPKRNAVIVEYLGDRYVVSIECKDESELPRLETEARKLLMIFQGMSSPQPGIA